MNILVVLKNKLIKNNKGKNQLEICYITVSSENKSIPIRLKKFKC
jgi:hypothetical protein